MRMLKYAASGIALCCNVALASPDMAAANSYYMVADHENDYSLAIDDGGPSFNGEFFMSWPDFKQSQAPYELELWDSATRSWQTVYTGKNLHYMSDEKRASGVYSFRLKCQGYAGCPSSGYIYKKTDVVLEPSFVNLAYNDKKQNVNVYWEEKATEGYIIEQSIDNGNTWEHMIPEGKEVRLYHGKNFTGFISTSPDVVLPKTTINSMRMANARSMGMQAFARMAVSQSTSAKFDPGNFKYRIKNCNMYRCGTYQESNHFYEHLLNPLIEDPTFESGKVQFYPNNADELVVSASRPIDANKSLRASLSNWGYIEWEHKYSTWDKYNPRFGINGMTARGLIRVDHLDPDSSLSIYPVANYYQGRNPNGSIKSHRLEGQQMIISRAPNSVDGRRLTVKTVRDEWEVDASEIIEFDQQLYLNTSEHIIKNVKFYVRLLGSNARFQLDNAQLYENGGLGQYDPSFSIYISNYIGELKTEWTDFAKTGLKDQPNLMHPVTGHCPAPNAGEFHYKVEYTPYGKEQWRTYYCGVGSRFMSQGGSSHTAFSTGRYEFRVNCKGFANCPDDGYVRGYTVILRGVESVLAQPNQAQKQVYLSWPKTLGAYGYIVEQSEDSGSTWRRINPRTVDESIHWQGNHLYTKNKVLIPNYELTNSTRFTYRVKACRYTRCQDGYGYSNEVILVGRDVSGHDGIGAITNFKADKSRILPGEAIKLSWERPKGPHGAFYNEHLLYAIFVTKPGEGEFLKWSGLEELSVKREGETGIQKLGTQTFRIIACDSFSNCSPSSTTSIEVVGRPPMPLEFSSNKTEVFTNDVVTLNWKMNPSYGLPVSYHLGLNEPSWQPGYFEPLLSQSTATSHQITFDKTGVHRLSLQACNQDGCSETRTLSIVVSSRPPALSIDPHVLNWNSILGATLYKVQKATCSENCSSAEQFAWTDVGNVKVPQFVIPEADKGKFYYRVSACFTSQVDCTKWSNVVEDRVKIKNVIFIHTDLLGSPVAESTIKE